MKRIGVALPLLLVAAVAGALTPASAQLNDRQDEIERRTQAIEQKLEALGARQRGILGRIRVVDSERQRVDAEVAQLDAQLGRLESRIAQKQRELVRAQQQLTLLTEHLQEILADLDARRSVYVERARAAYVAGPTAFLDGLLSSESFVDLVERYEYFESAADADAQLIEEIEVLRGEVDAKRALVDEKEQQIVAAKTRLEQDHRDVSKVRAERAGALAALEAVLSEKRTLLAEVERSKQHYEAVQAQLERESDQIAALLAARAAAASAATLPSGGGELLWPADGPVTSGFGYREHPVFGGRRFHAGIDIGAPYGAPVIAADGGIVAYVGPMSGYGNTIVVDHGGGLATTYNHLSGYSVGSGQDVARGAPIGSVGCTGYCTGPHLHFEVRVNGSPVDPMPYLQ